MSYELPDDALLVWLKNGVRKTRNIKLVDSDYTQLDDVPLSASKKLEWAAYRQLLRDLPSTITELNPDKTITVNWPTEPS